MEAEELSVEDASLEAQSTIDTTWQEDSPLDDILFNALEALSSKGYSVIQLGRTKEIQQKVAQSVGQRTDFVPLRPSTAEAYLGHGTKTSLVATLDYPVSSDDPISEYFAYMDELCPHLSQYLNQIMGTSLMDSLHSHNAVAGAMLRKDVSRSGKQPALEELDDVHVDDVLHFVRRRKFCMMQFIACDDNGALELFSRSEQKQRVRIPIGFDKLVIFDHDLMEFSYVPEGDSLVIQGWMLEVPPTWPGGMLSGSENDIRAVIGARGVALPPSDSVQVKSIGTKIGAHGLSKEVLDCIYRTTTDIFVKIPMARWDHDIYWTPNRDDGRGLAGVRHSGLVCEEDLMSFDHQRFRLSRDDADYIGPAVAMNFEVGYSCLYHGGHTLKTLNGCNMDIYCSGSFREAEHVRRMMNPATKFSANISEAHLLCSAFGVTGFGTLIDTACSASNTAANMAYQSLLKDRDARKQGFMCERVSPREALVIGQNAVDSPFSFIGLSQAHMLGNTGRSMTYDNSADGYARSEGCGSIYLRLHLDPDQPPDNLANVVSGSINQDGRSASLTAPNGPSQTALIRTCLSTCKRMASEVSSTELHGTGTAIGDPIETGSTKAALSREPREIPFIYQAGKSLTGHLELGAGVTGIIKTILATRAAVATPNNHLRCLNQNVDTNNLKGHIPTELVDIDREIIYSGISSFGFGGTNARFEIIASCRTGSHAVGLVGKTSSGVGAFFGTYSRRVDIESVNMFLSTCEVCRGEMCWMCGEAAANFGGGHHVCREIRKDSSSYTRCSKCYSGDYLIRGSGKELCDAGDPGKPIYILGSWNNFSFEEMQFTGSSYVHFVDAADSRYLHFSLALDKDPDLMLYPAHHASDANGFVVGPDDKSNDRTWRIDITRDCGELNGTFCKIEFVWDYGIKQISWRGATSEETRRREASIRALDSGVRSVVPAAPKEHTYSIVATFNDWQFDDLVRSSEENGLWETTFEIGYSGVVEFQLVAGLSFSQTIYPDGYRVVDSSVPVMGPDGNGTGKNWYILGLIGQEVRIQLRELPGGYSVTASSGTLGKRTWYTPNANSRVASSQYFLTGPFNDWKSSHELKEDSDSRGVYKTQLRISDERKSEEFRIIAGRKTMRGIMVHGYGVKVYENSYLKSYVCEANQGCLIEFVLDTRLELTTLSCHRLGIDEIDPVMFFSEGARKSIRMGADCWSLHKFHRS